MFQLRRDSRNWLMASWILQTERSGKRQDRSFLLEERWVWAAEGSTCETEGWMGSIRRSLRGKEPSGTRKECGMCPVKDSVPATEHSVMGSCL
jgi:hypothetical protein